MKVMLVLFLSFGVLQSAVIAGPGHDHSHSHAPIKAEKAEEIAKKTVAALIKKGKIDKSWDKLSSNKPYKKDFGKGPEWVVTIDNPKVKDEKKKKLYIFLSLDGHVLGSNFTGN